VFEGVVDVIFMALQVLSVADFHPKSAMSFAQDPFLVMTILLHEKSLVHTPAVAGPSCASSESSAKAPVTTGQQLEYAPKISHARGWSSLRKDPVHKL
jgi:hypothetical protein